MSCECAYQLGEEFRAGSCTLAAEMHLLSLLCCIIIAHSAICVSTYVSNSFHHILTVLSVLLSDFFQEKMFKSELGS